MNNTLEKRLKDTTKGNKKLGRGLAEISEVFLSSNFPSQPKEISFLNNIFVASTGNSLVRSFFTSYLTLELTKLRHKVLLLDAENSYYNPTLLFSNMETKPFADSFYNSLFPANKNGFLTNRIFFNTDHSFHLISLNSKNACGTGSKNHHSWKKFNEYFQPQKNNPKFIERTNLIIVSSPKDCLLKELRENTFFTPPETIILLTPINRDDIVSTYTLLKNILSCSGNKQIGLVVYGTEKEETAFMVYQKISDTLKKYLNKPVQYFGFLPHSDEVYRTLMDRSPAILNKETSDLNYPISACAQRIMKSLRPEND